MAADAVWFAVLDLKHSFFCIPLNLESQCLFAFEENQKRGKWKLQVNVKIFDS
jgi:hypothetical protein